MTNDTTDNEKLRALIDKWREGEAADKACARELEQVIRMSDEYRNDIGRFDGVQYVVNRDGKLRVVFEHNAESDVIEQVEDITQCSGKVGATQEHLACIDYPEQCLDTDTDHSE